MRSLVLLVVLAATARAEPETTHYYQYTLPGDAVALALYTGGMMADHTAGHDTAATALTTLGIAGSLLATPIVHAARGHWKRGFTSFALRAGLALVGAEVAKAGAQCADDDCTRNRTMLGAGIGFAVASVLDAAVLTEEKAPAAPAWSPAVTARAGGVVVGLGRAF